MSSPSKVFRHTVSLPAWYSVKNNVDNVEAMYHVGMILAICPFKVGLLCWCCFFVVYPQCFFLQLSLFFDILLCLTTDITKEDYIAGTFKQPHATSLRTDSQSPKESVMRRARAKLWKNLKEADLKMKAGEKWREGGEGRESRMEGEREIEIERERERERD